MAVLSALSVTLEVPELAPGVKFYSDAGLIPEITGNMARFRCQGQQRESLVLLGGAPKKRLHHISLRAEDLGGIASRIGTYGGELSAAPEGFEGEGLWLTDPHGMLIHLSERPGDSEIEPGKRFEINAPGAVIRKRRSAMLPSASYSAVQPLRLGHILVFTPDVLRSVEFVTGALGMGLADRAQEVIAFTCARKNSDHHVVAFAKSPGVGFHHVSFEVRDPDEVGRAGRALLAKAGKGDWGLGRHTIGSNFFHYIQDPWGSWFEYYSDMDHIDDYELWTPTNYGLQDSLANWAPPVPPDFVHNYELGSLPVAQTTA
jgi:catechol 2,3-dioxygenase-like lactoylglutathione lyase family enzyme